MSLRTELRSKLTQAMKNQNEMEKGLLRLIMGEVSTLDARQSAGHLCINGINNEDENVINVIRKLIESNKQTIELCKNSEDPRAITLAKENEYLGTFFAMMTAKEVEEALGDVVISEIKNAAKEGQAQGIAYKHLKANGVITASSEVITAVVKSIRA